MASQICWITSLRFEEATKIGMYRTTDLLLTFLFQYFFLGISSNVYSILGAVCIGVGMIIVISYKMIDQSNQDARQRKNIMEMDNMNNNETTLTYSEKRGNWFKRLILYKF